MAKTEKTTPTDKPTKQPTSGWLSSNFLWGGALVTLGILFLLSNLGVVEVRWGSIWRLWPLVIVFAGLSFLPLQGRGKTVAYSIAALAAVTLAWMVLTGNVADDSSTKAESFSINRTSDAINNLSVNVSGGATSIDIAATDKAPLVIGESRGNNTELATKSVIDGDQQVVTLSQSRSWPWFAAGSPSSLRANLGQNLPTDLTVDAGASSINADLSSIILRSLTIDSGASSIDLKLGDKHANTNVDIDTGVSSVSIRVPQGSGVKLRIDAGLSSKDIPENYEQIDDNTYQSPRFADAKNKITLNIDMGVSTFKLSAY